MISGQSWILWWPTIWQASHLNVLQALAPFSCVAFDVRGSARRDATEEELELELELEELELEPELLDLHLLLCVLRYVGSLREEAVMSFSTGRGTTPSDLFGPRELVPRLLSESSEPMLG